MHRRPRWRPLLLTLGGMLALFTFAAASLAGESLPEGAKVVALEVHPAKLDLAHPFDYRQLLLTAVLETGERLDATRLAQLEQPGELVEVSDKRLVRPRADGTGELIFSLGEQTVSLPVNVTGQNEPRKVSFVQDVMPAMSKMGCNAGTCHGSAKGKNGFKLSLRGYDPEFDHQALTDDLAGRRFNRSAPEMSLMLLKTTGAAPHVGGVRMRTDEPYYEMISSWIADGVELDLDSPRVSQIEIYPDGPVVPLPETKQQMAVLATYTDGSVRDVTAEAFIESNNTDVAEVDEHGLVTAVRRGEAAMLARYEGAYTATTLVVMGDRSGFEWQDVPESSFVDTLAYQKLRRLKIQPSDLCTDAEFVRRLYLDLTGLLPEPDQVRQFLADPRDTKVKREELIDKLVGSPDYVDFWTNKWADLLQVNRKFLTEKGAWAFRNWIAQALTSNTPYDEFVYDILTAEGSTYSNPPAAYYRVLREPGEVMENTTQLFLGVRFSCNKCHDHPFERWTQTQYYDLAAYFARVQRKKGARDGDEVVYDGESGEVPDPKSGEPVTPVFPYEHDDLASADSSRRERLARWVTSKENQYFAKSFVNRMWSYLLGVGLIEPVDDIRASNPASNPELLDRLTQDFVDSGFDVRHLIRTICRSRVYQHSIKTNEWNAGDQTNFSHAVARRLPAETLYDVIHQATGSVPKLPGVPVGFRAVQLPDTNVKVPGGFLDAFGRPPRESACECERSSGMMLGPVLNLVNGPIVAEAIADENNRIARLVAAEADDARVVAELFLATLSRPPTKEELATGLTAIKDGESRLDGAQDLTWALLNSSAFLFNR